MSHAHRLRVRSLGIPLFDKEQRNEIHLQSKSRMVACDSSGIFGLCQDRAISSAIVSSAGSIDLTKPSSSRLNLTQTRFAASLQLRLV